MLKQKIAILVLPMALLAFSNVNAQTEDTSSRKEAVEAKKEELKERKEERIEERKNRFCNRVENKVRKRANVFKNHQRVRVNRHRRIVERIISLADKLDGKGYDTAQLRTHLEEYSAKIDIYEEEFKTFIEELSSSEDYTCGESEGKFVDQIKQARIQLGVTRQKRAEIWEYYNQVIKEDLKALKNQQI